MRMNAWFVGAWRFCYPSSGSFAETKFDVINWNWIAGGTLTSALQYHAVKLKVIDASHRYKSDRAQYAEIRVFIDMGGDEG